MGNAASAPRRLSRGSVSSTGASSTGAVDEQLGGPSSRAPTQAVDQNSPSNRNQPTGEEHEEHDDFDESFDVPTFSTRRPLRRHSTPNGDDDADTLCDSASIMTAFTDSTMTADPLQAYVAGSSVVSSAVEAAMEVMNSDVKGWRRDVALGQLEWLAADGARRARWVRHEAAARARRAKGRRASLGGSKRPEMRLSTAGEERVVAEDTATARRVNMERAAGDARAGVEDDAKHMLERAIEAVHVEEAERHLHETEDSAQAYATKRAKLRAADEVYHSTCAEAAKEHAGAMAHAALAHERSFSNSTVTYMGRRLREPDAQGQVTFTAAAGAAIESNKPRSAWSGQYKVGRWGQ